MAPTLAQCKGDSGLNIDAPPLDSETTGFRPFPQNVHDLVYGELWKLHGPIVVTPTWLQNPAQGCSIVQLYIDYGGPVRLLRRLPYTSTLPTWLLTNKTIYNAGIKKLLFKSEFSWCEEVFSGPQGATRTLSSWLDFSVIESFHFNISLIRDFSGNSESRILRPKDRISKQILEIMMQYTFNEEKGQYTSDGEMVAKALPT